MTENSDREKKLAELKRIVSGNAEKRVFNGKDFSGLSVGGLNIENASFVKSTFDSMNIYNSKFKKCEFSKVTFKDASMFKVDFDECKLNDIDFSSCDMDAVDFGDKCTLVNCKFKGEKTDDKGEEPSDDIICDVTTLDGFNIAPALNNGFEENKENKSKYPSYVMQIGPHSKAILEQGETESKTTSDKFKLMIAVGDDALPRFPLTVDIEMNDAMDDVKFKKNLISALTTVKTKLEKNVDYDEVKQYAKEIEKKLETIS